MFTRYIDPMMDYCWIIVVDAGARSVYQRVYIRVRWENVPA